MEAWRGRERERRRERVIGVEMGVLPPEEISVTSSTVERRGA